MGLVQHKYASVILAAERPAIPVRAMVEFALTGHAQIQFSGPGNERALGS
ncbi:hypothetical protein SAMN05444164_3762 [Bradyrhizobium erythrophlei]|uniref:Uncharacterized protein n=1 Tax=Bradyrhizobium erythrophlei TaxID=1437360 RepID=A0A1H4Y3B4_9BRAD|nr:hypothetical protein SAMN05444164_3762 [Bradyrhizobium erythrophlei]